MKSRNSDLLDSIKKDGAISADNEAKLAQVVKDFVATKKY
jgi:hypothetical protein